MVPVRSPLCSIRRKAWSSPLPGDRAVCDAYQSRAALGSQNVQREVLGALGKHWDRAARGGNATAGQLAWVWRMCGTSPFAGSARSGTRNPSVLGTDAESPQPLRSPRPRGCGGERLLAALSASGVVVLLMMDGRSAPQAALAGHRGACRRGEVLPLVDWHRCPRGLLGQPVGQGCSWRGGRVGPAPTGLRGV
jgi:hypothetical protein